MVQAHSGLQIVELYINSFSESIPDIGEGNSDDEQGILGSSEMIHIGMRWMNQICSLRVMMFLDHLLGGEGETIEMLETSVRRVGKIDSGRSTVDRSNIGSDDDDHDHDHDVNSNMARSDNVTYPPKSD